MNNIEQKYNVLDLFCGCGGLSLGFEEAGYKVLLGVDIWEDALKTYAYNHKGSKTLCADMSTIQGEDVKKHLGNNKVDVIIGGPPCQGFSIAGKRIVDDERNKLYKGFVRMVEYFKPSAFVMENVPNILSIGGGAIKEAIFKDFEDLGYKINVQVVLASNYGVPQNRRRAVFVGLRNGDKYDFPLPLESPMVTSKEALDDLPEGSLDNGSPYPIKANNPYQEYMRAGSNGVFNHEITIHNDRTKEMNPKKPEFARYIEVKSTKRVTEPKFDKNWGDSLNITAKEWVAAEQYGEYYNIYRVYFTKNKTIIVRIQNPFKKAEEGLIEVYPTIYQMNFDTSVIEYRYGK